jgi:hypothetical protein
VYNLRVDYYFLDGNALQVTGAIVGQQIITAVRVAKHLHIPF